MPVTNTHGASERSIPDFLCTTCHHEHSSMRRIIKGPVFSFSSSGGLDCRKLGCPSSLLCSLGSRLFSNQIRSRWLRRLRRVLGDATRDADVRIGEVVYFLQYCITVRQLGLVQSGPINYVAMSLTLRPQNCPRIVFCFLSDSCLSPRH